MNNLDLDVSTDVGEFSIPPAEVQHLLAAISHQSTSETSWIDVAREIRVALASSAPKHKQEVVSRIRELCSNCDEPMLLSLLDERVAHVAEVKSTEEYWHSGYALQPASNYLLQPSTVSRWTLNRNRRPIEWYYYSSERPGVGLYRWARPSEISIPDAPWPYSRGSRLAYLAYVYALVWQVQPNGSAQAEVHRIDDHRGVQIRTSPHGASVHFYIPDLAGTFSDNEGRCLVNVILG